ncbi:hypothetical protein TREMEDRAFT_74773 [Tremella mesenterica DSM 1558]|uniref:uncharacterized protein n=1 Tax=Tremella mesenterica (strain ATCC 24925 / CBS 8224 / DSM 1558 / NBRC 9311 / NRRL Y-6157 / RJB 2259-6 / UBC 559-6) TaxID=578456 RepID=UPI00032BEC8B|nr:uncharacterized protein TREMEDRAFT_74773 [Tremella mesenterica DSM 1558]EIW66262.1 hypothetical protein TREMEDRAFT_74773 [Tremella mesenterica DSM 1558]
MQSVVDAATSAANIATTHAQNIASAAVNAVGYGTEQVSNEHEHDHDHRVDLPPDAQVSDIIKMDSDGLSVFEDEEVRHEILVKLNKLAVEDVRHGLKEVAALDLVVEGGVNKGISYYHPKRFFKVHRPMGIDYIGEIEIEAGKSIHVRCHKAGAGGKTTFHSIDTRPGEEHGAVFVTGEPIKWFEY